MRAAVDAPGWLAARRLLRQALVPLAAARGFRVVGRERLPRSRCPLLVACNHAALVDSVYLILAIRPRFVICGARPSYFGTAARRALMALANIAPIPDRAAYLGTAMRILCAGGIVLTYPEMGRNPDGLGAFEPWAAEAALAIGAPLLPCYLYGTAAAHTGPPRLFVGRALEPAGDAEDLTRQLRAAIVALSPTELPGVP